MLWRILQKLFRETILSGAKSPDLCGLNGSTKEPTESLPVEGVPAPDFQSGGAGFQTRGNARHTSFWALALVAKPGGKKPRQEHPHKGWSFEPGAAARGV